MRLDRRQLRRWTAGALVLTLLLAAISMALHLTVRRTPWNDLFSYFHLGSEGGIPAYWNAALLALVAGSAVLSGLTSPDGPTRRGWLLVAGVTGFLSLDEATQLHERTGDLVTANPLPTFPWVVVGAPLAALLVVVLVLGARPLPAAVRGGLGTALALYVLGALGLEAVSGYYWRQQRPNASELFGTVEELLEMGACILALHVILGALTPLRVEARAGEEQGPGG